MLILSKQGRPPEHVNPSERPPYHTLPDRLSCTPFIYLVHFGFEFTLYELRTSNLRRRISDVECFLDLK